MGLAKIEIEVPTELLKYVNYRDTDYQKKIRELMIYELIKDERISFGKGAELLGIDKITLIMDLGKMGIPYFDLDIKDVLTDVDNIEKALGGLNKCQ